MGSRLGQLKQQDGDVVAAACVVGLVDKGLAESLQAGRAGSAGALQDCGDIFVGKLAGEAIGGEQVEIARLRGEVADLGFDLRLGADGAGNDVAQGGGAGPRAR